MTDVIGPEAPFDARWDLSAINIVNQIWQIPSDWPETRRKAHAQILIIQALKAADALSHRAYPVLSNSSKHSESDHG